MAPATSTATPAAPTPTLIAQGQTFAGDEFSNNLFSDLAPLLTLFGEQVTKQFLSMSMGWADSVLLAMGPLGILTTVVSAIRVGGVRKLKALVGRARESLATAEQELLTSTSDSVCEMWTGTDVVRQLGKPKTMELILVNRPNRPTATVMGLAGAINGTYMRKIRKNKGLRLLGGSEDSFVPINPRTRDALIPDKLTSQAPNLALNSENSLAPKAELWIWAVIGIILQSLALVFPALTSYLWRFPKGGSHVQGYAYPCFIVGTLAVILGVVLCSHVIESVTHETTFGPDRDNVLQVTRLQRACTVSDQSFPSFLIMNPPGDKKIRTSRLLRKPDRRLSQLAGFASLLTVSGFIGQFVGLRGLHWSATVLQLGVTLLMTGVRSWVRRGLADQLPCVELNPAYELDATALFLLAYSKGTPSKLNSVYPFGWEILTGNEWKRTLSLLPHGVSSPTVETQSPDYFEAVLSLRKDLADLMPDTPRGDEITQMTSKLAQAIIRIVGLYEDATLNRSLQAIPRTSDQYHFEWSHLVIYQEGTRRKCDKISCRWEKGSLEANKENQSRLESILRLWACSFDASHIPDSKPTRYLVLGPGKKFESIELEQWLKAAVECGLAEEDDQSHIDRLILFRRPIFGLSTLPFQSSRPVRDYEYICTSFKSESLIHQYSLELLSGFMGSLAKSIKAVGGLTTQSGRQSEFGPNLVYTFGNSVLRSFSQVLVDCGLVRDIDEANIFVIPPFFREGLLPTKAGNVTFKEPTEASGSHSADQNDHAIPTGQVQREHSDHSEQTDVSAPSQEAGEDAVNSESLLEGTTRAKPQASMMEYDDGVVSADEEDLLKDNAVSETSQPTRSASGGGNDKGKAKQE